MRANHSYAQVRVPYSRSAHGQSLVYLHAAARKWLWPSRAPKPLLRILITPHIHTTPYYSSYTHYSVYIHYSLFPPCLSMSICLSSSIGILHCALFYVAARKWLRPRRVHTVEAVRGLGAGPGKIRPFLLKDVTFFQYMVHVTLYRISYKK